MELPFIIIGILVASVAVFFLTKSKRVIDKIIGITSLLLSLVLILKGVNVW